jgi:hypothetical protein
MFISNNFIYLGNFLKRLSTVAEFFPCGRLFLPNRQNNLEKSWQHCTPSPPPILTLRTRSSLRAAAPAVALQRAVEKEGGRVGDPGAVAQGR